MGNKVISVMIILSLIVSVLFISSGVSVSAAPAKPYSLSYTFGDTLPPADQFAGDSGLLFYYGLNKTDYKEKLALIGPEGDKRWAVTPGRTSDRFGLRIKVFAGFYDRALAEPININMTIEYYGGNAGTSIKPTTIYNKNGGSIAQLNEYGPNLQLDGSETWKTQTVTFAGATPSGNNRTHDFEILLWDSNGKGENYEKLYIHKITLERDILTNINVTADGDSANAVFSYENFETSDIFCNMYIASYDEQDKLLDIKISEQLTAVPGKNRFEFSADIADGSTLIKAFAWDNKQSPICKSARASLKSLKILAIGNSFSEDALQWLYDIAKDAEFDVVLGSVYLGSSSLSTHWSKANGDLPDYAYKKNNSGTWTIAKEKATMLDGLKDEEWDIIVLQQVSSDSGRPSTYEPYLINLINYINANKTNSQAKLAWHMTWAYQQDSTHGGFASYDRNQMTMYNAIVDTVQQRILPSGAFTYVIPAGTAVQNVRTSEIGDTLTRDGYHLSLNLGRYIAGLTWLRTLTGISVDDITYVPDKNDIPDAYLDIVKAAVNFAAEKPFEVTPVDL